MCAVGARPLATTDNLNFGNPEKPEIMGQFVGAIKGIGEACRALDMPIVSGNVSLYNETDGKGILPTPTIGAVGMLASLDELIAGRPAEGDVAVLIGATRRASGPVGAAGRGVRASRRATRRRSIWRPSGGNGEFLLANRKLIRAATDLSDGGLALAAFEMAEAAGLGVTLDAGDTGALFGEDQARYLVACAAGRRRRSWSRRQGRGCAGGSGRAVRRDGRSRLGGDAAPLAELSAALPQRLCRGRRSLGRGLAGGGAAAYSSVPMTTRGMPDRCRWKPATSRT